MLLFLMVSRSFCRLALTVFAGPVPFRRQLSRATAAGRVDAGNHRPETQITGMGRAVGQKKRRFFAATGQNFRIAGEKGAALAHKAAGGTVQTPGQRKAKAVQHHFRHIAGRVIKTQRVRLA